MRTRHFLIGLLVMLALQAAVPTAAVQPPPKPAAVDGFVPVTDAQQQEELPSPPLLMSAYAVAWIAVFGWAWTIWTRLGRVEHDIVDARRRAETGGRR
jgi:hypothetical protein